MEGYERDQYLMEDYEKDHTEGSEAEVQADADAREDKIDKLKKIIQEAWNEGNLYVEAGLDRKDTFGDFLDRAVAAIHSRGYRKNQPIIKKRAEFKSAYNNELEADFSQEKNLYKEECRKLDKELPLPSGKTKGFVLNKLKADERLLIDKNTVVLCQEFLCKIFNQTSTFLETVKALKEREGVK